MTEFFIVANSFSAPFFSDQSTSYIEADSPEEALGKFADSYTHPAGLYAAICYASADAHHKNREPLAKWLCNLEIEKKRVTAGLGSYSYFRESADRFRVDETWYDVSDPGGGKLVKDGVLGSPEAK